MCAEVAATLALKAALQHPGWYALVIGGYAIAFASFAVCLQLGIRIGVAYAIRWSVGVAMTAVIAGAVFDDEALTLVTGMAIGLVVIGVLTVKLGSRRGRDRIGRGGRTGWGLLVGAIVTEVGTVASPRASEGLSRKMWTVPIAAGYVLAGLVLSIALRQGFALGLAYATWTACGAVAATVIAKVILHEPLTRTTALGLALIAAAVVAIGPGGGVGG